MCLGLANGGKQPAEMTDKEIIQALEDWIKNFDGKAVDFITLNLALDLINRQQEEIEKLTINMNAFGLGMKREKERADTIRADTIKEFADRLKAEALNWLVTVGEIDDLVKEMVGADNGEE